MELPLDIWKLISLYLDFNQLALSKELWKIYDDEWFKNKLCMEYPNCKQNNNSWKELYKRSLKSGNILKLRHYDGKYKSEELLFSSYDNAIQGFKIAEIDYYFYMILTFDGDLYSSFLQGDMWINKLLDSNVSDITNNSYIKENKWYLLDYNHEILITLILQTNDNFIAVTHTDEHICAITNNKLYCYGDDELKIIDNCNDNVKLTCGAEINMVLHTDGSVSRYNPHIDIFETCIIKDVKNIYQDVIKLKDDSIINIIIDCFHDERKFITEEICNNNKLQGTIGYYGEPVLLINNNVCKYNTSNSEINPNYSIDPTLTSLTLVRKNVKNIYGWLGTHYFIY